MDTSKQHALLDAIVRYAEACDQVAALVLVGSQARAEKAADAYSDIDLIMAVTDVDKFIRSDAWLRDIGKAHISFTEHTVDGQMERRVLFDHALDVDFVVMDAAAAARALETGEAADILRRGYKVLVDKRGIALPQQASVSAFAPASGADFSNIVQDFWFHTVWSAKKLTRGEIWAAKFCVDGYMKRRLLWMIEQHAHARRPGVNTWYAGRFIDDWADPDILRDLQTAFAHYDQADIARALRETMALFRRLATEVAEANGLHYPAHADDYATGWALPQLEPLLPLFPEAGDLQ